MKKNLFFVIAMLIATGMSAQLYVGAKLGYGFGAQKTAFGTKQADKSQSNIYGTLGQGIPLGLKVGYFFNDNLGVELGMNYFMSSTLTKADVNMTGYTQNTTVKSTQIRLMPTLVYKTDMGVYGRFGMLVPVGGSTIATSKFVTGGATTDIEQSFSGSFSIGFVSSLGYEFALNDNIKLFGEVEYVGLQIKGKSASMTKYTVNGTDKLASIPTYSKETNYVDELTSSSNNNTYNPAPDMSKAADELNSTSGYSAVRINIGISYYFN